MPGSFRYAFRMALLCLLGGALTGLPVSAQHTPAGRVVLDVPGYPLVFELDPGETMTIARGQAGKTRSRTVKLISVKPFFEPNEWFGEGLPPRNYACAEVVVEVSGRRVTLLHRPYQMPVVVHGLRLYVETIREWAENAEIADLKDVRRQVRLAAGAAGEPWGPATLVFPIRNYRWRSAAYNNTWSSLVPYNKLYYHRGEDYGAMPDRLDVVAPFDGTVTATPGPAGDGKSNEIRIRNAAGIVCRLSHMNTESIRPGYPVGTPVAAGTVLARTGMTWDGRKSQEYDPHCHVELRHGEVQLASFPYLMEAYLRDYPDPVLAVAGGYAFTQAGRAVQLDGSRSLARPGGRTGRHVWTLHDGRVATGKRVTVQYDRPGLYTEELQVTGPGGATDRDFVQVRVYEAGRGRQVAYGWAYHFPVRGIRPGTPVLFWNRLLHVQDPVTIRFGDGTPPEPVGRETTHAYRAPGRYVVTFSARGPREEPVAVKLEVVVE
jgi:murein DD-endopeptidase MepM/ murein hydrolase activator NlpD